MGRNPLALEKAKHRVIRTSEVLDKSHGYTVMRRTNLKEMHIVRYADDFRIFCRSKEDAVKQKKLLRNGLRKG